MCNRKNHISLPVFAVRDKQILWGVAIMASRIEQQNHLSLLRVSSDAINHSMLDIRASRTLVEY